MRDTGWVRPCACGGNVTADPLDPTPRYRSHVEGRCLDCHRRGVRLSAATRRLLILSTKARMVAA